MTNRQWLKELKIYQRKFLKLDFAKLGPIGFSKKSGNGTTIVSFELKGGKTEIFIKDCSGLLKKFTDKFKNPLCQKQNIWLLKKMTA